jgi:hypothetical protein
MIAIDNNTSKLSLLEQLSAVAGSGEKLYIQVVSLPYFISTKVGFKILIYQLKNYPREIFWTSRSFHIMQFLQSSGANTSEFNGIENDHFARHNQSKNKSFDFSPYPKPPVKIGRKSIIQITTNQPIIKISPNKTVIQSTNSKDPVTLNLPIKKIESSLKAESLLNDAGYKPSSLIESEIFENDFKEGNEFNFANLPAIKNKPVIIPKSNTFVQNKLKELPSSDTALYLEYTNPKKDQSQNLDSWINKIESTKKALEKYQTKISQTGDKKPLITNIKPNFKINFPSLKIPNASKIKTNSPIIFTKKRISIVASLFFAMVFSVTVIGMLVFFPTKVYTIDLVPVSKKETLKIELPVSNFENQDLILQTTAEQPLTVKAKEEINRSIGVIKILNSSGNYVSFDREGIILRSRTTGKTYRQVASVNEPYTFRIAPFGGTVNINIQATQNGSASNLENGQILSISNLKGESMGNLITGTVVSPITNIVESDNQLLVTEQNQNSLKAQVRDTFELQKQKQVEILQTPESEVYANLNWFREYPIDFVFSGEIGSVSDKLTTEAKAQTELFYLQKQELNTFLEARYTRIKKIQNINVISTEGTFSNNASGNIVLNLDIDYIQKFDLDKQFLSQMLNQNELGKAKEDLQKQYPNIKDIQKTETGLSLPGIPSRLEISIKENL